ncbi:MAG: hypothetical protein AAGL24_09880 [Pseudomonadota bacterium]
MKVIREAGQLLPMLEHGDLNRDMSQKLRDVIGELTALAEDTKRKVSGHVALKIKFEVDGDTIKVMAELDSKTPKQPRKPTFYFHNGGDDLHTEHPRQRGMFDTDQPLRAIDGETA